MSTIKARTDVLTADQRRRCMANIKGKNTKPEMKLRLACWSMGLRYQLDSPLLGKPDFVFPKEKVAVFLDGCFWHGCANHYTAPSNRRDFWEGKLQKNLARDFFVTALLGLEGWEVIRIWEHEVKHPNSLAECVELIRTTVLQRRKRLKIPKNP